MNSTPIVGVRPPAWLGAEAGDMGDRLVQWAVDAEGLGFDMVYVGDRLLSKAHGPGTTLAVYQAAMLDPFVVLAAMAARTHRVRLAPLVAVLPFRHPAYVAKITASLDIVSNGRLDLGVGSGWSDPELRMFGIDRRARGNQMEEAIELLRRLWSGEAVTHEGKFWSLAEAQVLPRPVQQPGPPIWLGSFAPDDAVTWSGTMSPRHERVLDRIGRLADAWAPLTYSAGHKRQLSPELLGAGWQRIKQSARQEGRTADAVQVYYPHWIAVVRNSAERKQCEAALAEFFPGTYEEAKHTYLIGAPEEIAASIRGHCTELERVDGYLLTPIIQTDEQLEVIAEELAPTLRDPAFR